MPFMALNVILFRKKNKSITLALRFFVYLLLSLTNEWPRNTLLLFEEDAIEYILRAKIWLDGLDSVFWQVSIEILFVFLLFSLAALKMNKDRS